jgi:hypothetical protein
MILLVGSRFDPAAAELASAWRHAGAVLCDAGDLTARGWRYEPHMPRQAVAVAEGRRVPAREIEAVVTLRATVYPIELIDVVEDDRAFVAAEIGAFLRAFLDALEAPVVNRPAEYSLAGPVLAPERWAQLARAAGVPAVSIERRVPGTILAPALVPRATRTVFVAGEQAEAGSDPSLARAALAITRRCGATMLEAAFTADGDEPRFVSATAQPSLREATRRDLLLAALAPPRVAV